MRAKSSREALPLPFDRSLFRPGQRVCVAVSAGADSTALLRALCAVSGELGIVISALHVHHGIRAADADADAAFVAALAGQLGVSCEVVRVDTPAHARLEKQSLETAARNLRYEIFRRLLREQHADAIATAHNLDDQAETVLMKLLRGAWTEGLSGIHPILREPDMQSAEIVRPLLAVRRAQIESYLSALGQTWREDVSNLDPAHTRNRLRHHLLPMLREYNPNFDRQLARMAAIAREEEIYWQNELVRILPGLLLPGKPTRGGGRSVSTNPGHASFAMEVSRLQAYPPAVCRRILRAAVQQLHRNPSPLDEPISFLDFEHTEELFRLVQDAPTSTTRRLQLAHDIFAERTARELRLERSPASASPDGPAPQYVLPIPGQIDAVAYGECFVATCNGADPPTFPAAIIRPWQPGDRVTLQHSSGPKKVKEVLERMHVQGRDRERWPVVLWQGNIVWMQGVVVTPPLVEGAIPFIIKSSPLVTRGSGGKS